MASRVTSVKVHVFEPSGRSIRTVVGPGTEHWVDSEMRVCSCRAFHYNDGAACSHIKAVLSAKPNTVRFSDDEYEGFVSALLEDIWANTAAK